VVQTYDVAKSTAHKIAFRPAGSDLPDWQLRTFRSNRKVFSRSGLHPQLGCQIFHVLCSEIDGHPRS
jgi:hypothetical protein